MSDLSTAAVIDETQIWETYLLPPSPLPTILPYNIFLSLVPAGFRNDAEYESDFKRIYRDLQLQRSITIEQIRDNIKRECGQRATNLRAILTQRIAMEEGDKLAAKQFATVSLKRKRRDEKIRQEINADDVLYEEDEVYSSDYDEFTDLQGIAAQQAMYNDKSNTHPAAHVLPLIDGDVKFHDAEIYHTKRSLFDSMTETDINLRAEIDELERDCARLRNEINETIGGLSDLRYGKRHGEAASNNAHTELLQAIDNFKQVISSKAADRSE